MPLARLQNKCGAMTKEADPIQKRLVQNSATPGLVINGGDGKPTSNPTVTLTIANPSP